jgi:large subunit ribosomal protein L22
METRAVLRGVRLSVDKGRLVADMIRGKKVDQALNILTFTQKKAAGIVKKVWNLRLPTLNTTTVQTSTS